MFHTSIFLPPSTYFFDQHCPITMSSLYKPPLPMLFRHTIYLQNNSSNQILPSSTMATSTNVLSSFVNPTAIATTPKSFLTPPSSFTPFTSSNSSLVKSLKMNAVHKKSFTCKSQVSDHVNTGNNHCNHIHTRHIFFLNFFIYIF